MKPATLRRPVSGGFTLIETLVVMVISVGVVILMGALYSAVGRAALALKGGNPEWAVQTLLREQLSYGFSVSGRAWLAGNGHELTLFSWKSRLAGLDGKPVIAQYRFEPKERALTYREAPLPPWWGDRHFPTVGQLADALRSAEPVKIMGAVVSLQFSFIPIDAANQDNAGWQTQWHHIVAPKLIVLRFERTREHTLWLDPRSVDAR